MTRLGISARPGPSSACLFRDGRIVAAVREELLSGEPGDTAFPRQAVEYCLRAGKIGPAALETVLVAGGEEAPEDAGSPRSLLRRLFGGARPSGLRAEVAEALHPGLPVENVSIRDALAEGAFRLSPLDEACVLAVGEETWEIARGSAAGIRWTDSLPAPRSREEKRAALERAREAGGSSALVVAGAGSSALETFSSACELFDSVWVDPAGAGSTALGAALGGATGEGASGRPLGPGYNVHQIRTFLRSRSVRGEELPHDGVADRVASLLTEGLEVAWFSGRVDFAELPLASRAILRVPRENPQPGDVWLVPAESAPGHFDLPGGWLSPLLPAGSVLVLRIHRPEHRVLHALLGAIGSATGSPLLLARRLALPGGPDACAPRQGWEAYDGSGAQAILMERILLRTR